MGFFLFWIEDALRTKEIPIEDGQHPLDLNNVGIWSEILLRISREFVKTVEWLLTGEGLLRASATADTSGPALRASQCTGLPTAT